MICGQFLLLAYISIPNYPTEITAKRRKWVTHTRHIIKKNQQISVNEKTLL
jgi:hypothetical protein